VGASAAGASAAPATIKKSDERETRENNGTNKSKSRSLSRGKRGSIFDRLAGKKDEVKEEAKEAVGKKDEPAKDVEAPATEPAKDGKLDLNKSFYEGLGFNGIDHHIAPAETAAAAAAEEPKKEEAKAEESKKVEEAKKAEEPKQTRRSSRFGDFFKTVQGRSPAHEKKADAPPAVPPKDTETPKTDDKKEEEATAAVAAAPLPVIAGEELKQEEKKEEPKKETTTTPKAEKKTFFDRFKPKDLPAKPATTAAPKEEPAKAAEPATDAAATTDATMTEGEPAKADTETPALNGEAKDNEAPRPSADKEKRRSSFFSGDIAGSLKKITQQPKKSEEKPQTNGDHAKDKPAETPAAAPASKKENPVAKLGRRFSTAIRNATKEPTKKETPAPKKAEETTAPAEAKTEEPANAEEAKPAEETKPAEGEKAVNSIGDVVPEAVNVGSAPPANATVSATA
jgi:hypothetical protein